MRSATPKSAPWLLGRVPFRLVSCRTAQVAACPTPRRARQALNSRPTATDPYPPALPRNAQPGTPASCALSDSCLLLLVFPTLSRFVRRNPGPDGWQHRRGDPPSIFGPHQHALENWRRLPATCRALGRPNFPDGAQRRQTRDALRRSPRWPRAVASPRARGKNRSHPPHQQPRHLHARDRRRARLCLFRLVRPALLRLRGPRAMDPAAAPARGRIRHRHYADPRRRPAHPQLRSGSRLLPARSRQTHGQGRVEDRPRRVPPRLRDTVRLAPRRRRKG